MADTDGMDGPHTGAGGFEMEKIQPIAVEPRTTMWARAELIWDDGSGNSCCAAATIEDKSPSGACLRVKRPFPVGSRITVKWHREQFVAQARNCRSDGMDFLLGVLRDESATPVPAGNGSLDGDQTPADPILPANAAANDIHRSQPVQQEVQQDPEASVEKQTQPANTQMVPLKTLARDHRNSDRRPPAEPSEEQQEERNVMQPKTVFPKFWRRPGEADDKAAPAPEASASPASGIASQVSAARGTLLSYEDIYHAAGIMNLGSGYGIHKVVEMLNSERIRDLSRDIKRASVLMALEAAGTSTEELLDDATRRRHALDSYETAQRRQVEEFEARKAAENAQIEGELERVRAHYAERIQNNLEQVAREKEVLRNWQMAVQHESQRISEVLELCGKPVSAAQGAAMQAASGRDSSKPQLEPVTPDAQRRTNLRPSLLSGD